jgi:hypothetical protein
MSNVREQSHILIQQHATNQEPQYRSPVSGRRSQAPSGLSLETPTSPSNFEWDERNGHPSGEKFVDGMASLTSASHEGGYLGLYYALSLIMMLTSSQGSHPGLHYCA